MKKPLDLAGPTVPEDFVDDGLSGVPDILFNINFRPAGRVHDYEYHLIRSVIRRIRQLKERRKIASQHNRQDLKCRIRSCRIAAKRRRKHADANFKENLRRCAVNAAIPYTRIRAFLIRRLYWRGVRILGRWAVRGPGHEGN